MQQEYSRQEGSLFQNPEQFEERNSSIEDTQPLNNKLYNGVGRYTWEEEDSSYFGQINNGLLDGFGEFVWHLPNKQVEKYEGIFKDGLMSQVGTYTWSDGTQYSGYWSNGELDKVGILRTRKSIDLGESGQNVFGILSKLIVSEKEDEIGTSVKSEIEDTTSDAGQFQLGQLKQQSIATQKFNKERYVDASQMSSEQQVPMRAPRPRNLNCSRLEILICKSINGRIYKLYPLPQLLIDSILNVFKPPDQSSTDDDTSLNNIVDDRQMKQYVQKGISMLIKQTDKWKGQAQQEPPQVKQHRKAHSQSQGVTDNDVRRLRLSRISPQSHLSVNAPSSPRFELSPQPKKTKKMSPSTSYDTLSFEEDLPLLAQFEGLDPNGQKLLIKAHAYYPNTFQKIRESVNIQSKHFLDSICGQNLQEKKSTGKSGSLFFISENKQFFLKTINNVEKDVLLSSLPQYLRHITQSPVRASEAALQQDNNTSDNLPTGSLLCKYLGLYSLILSSSNLKKHKSVNIVVMESVFKMDYSIDRRYDLKGSSKKRTCGPENYFSQASELKDLDLDMRLRLNPNYMKQVITQLDEDVNFLEQIHVMDYSLLIGVHRPFKKRSPVPQRHSSDSNIHEKYRNMSTTSLDFTPFRVTGAPRRSISTNSTQTSCRSWRVEDPEHPSFEKNRELKHVRSSSFFKKQGSFSGTEESPWSSWQEPQMAWEARKKSNDVQEEDEKIDESLTSRSITSSFKNFAQYVAQQPKNLLMSTINPRSMSKKKSTQHISQIQQQSQSQQQGSLQSQKQTQPVQTQRTSRNTNIDQQLPLSFDASQSYIEGQISREIQLARNQNSIKMQIHQAHNHQGGVPISIMQNLEQKQKTIQDERESIQKQLAKLHISEQNKPTRLYSSSLQTQGMDEKQRLQTQNEKKKHYTHQLQHFEIQMQQMQKQQQGTQPQNKPQHQNNNLLQGNYSFNSQNIQQQPNRRSFSYQPERYPQQQKIQKQNLLEQYQQQNRHQMQDQRSQQQVQQQQKQIQMRQYPLSQQNQSKQQPQKQTHQQHQQKQIHQQPQLKQTQTKQLPLSSNQRRHSAFQTSPLQNPELQSRSQIQTQKVPGPESTRNRKHSAQLSFTQEKGLQQKRTQQQKHDHDLMEKNRQQLYQKDKTQGYKNQPQNQTQQLQHYENTSAPFDRSESQGKRKFHLHHHKKSKEKVTPSLFQSQSWNQEVGDTMVDQIQKLITSGHVFARPHSDQNIKDVNKQSQNGNNQNLSGQLDFITQQISKLINQKLADYNRLLNIGGGSGEQYSQSGLILAQHKGKYNIEKYGLDLPSDKKDDVIKITMLLVALVVRKVEARQYENIEKKRIKDQLKHEQENFTKELTKGGSACQLDNTISDKCTDEQWLQKQPRKSFMGAQVNCIAIPQKPRGHSKSFYEAPEQVIVCFGIIDYLVEFNWYKYMEYSMKTAMYGVSGVKGVSVQPPDNYSQRFLQFMKTDVFELI